MNEARKHGSFEAQALQARFLARAQSDVTALESFCDELKAAGHMGRLQPLTAVCALLHRLGGTAGSFGYDAFGARARLLSATAASMLGEEAAKFEPNLALLAEGMQSLRRALQSPVDSSTAVAAGKAPAAAHSSGTMLVCVVSTDRAFSMRLSQVLEGFGYGIRSFSSVDEVERVIGQLEPAAIIAKLDHPESQLPGLRRLRAIQGDPVPLVVVTAGAEFADYLAAVRIGADGCFLEPVDLPRLEARLHYLIERRRRDGLRVMLVDDDLELLEACAHVLEAAGMVVHLVDDPSSALAAIADFRPELILMDIRMPQCTGPELAQVIRLNEEWLHVPIVYMSSQSDGADQLLATRKAGEAFISKPIDARELIATVAANGRRARQMVETASRDTLTGMLKHSFISEHLASELERALRNHGSTCAVMIDIDNFKNVNDQHGHLVGDVVIRTLATVLRQRLRVIDGIGRIGGEEFLAVLSNCAAAEGVSIVDAVRLRFAEIEFAGAEGVFHSSFSAGVAESLGSTHSMEDLLATADKALYRAKALGRNRVVRSGQ